MNRLHEVTGVAIDTLATVADDLLASCIGIDALASSAKFATLDEIAERRAALNGRLGETRIAVTVLIEQLRKAREE